MLGISLAPKHDYLLIPQLLRSFPMCFVLALPLPISGTRTFKFLNYLTNHPKFLPIVADFWIQTGGTATTLGELCWKLKQIKRVLRKINRENFSKIQERVINANSLLKDVQE